VKSLCIEDFVVSNGTSTDVHVDQLMDSVPVDQLSVDTHAAQTTTEEIVRLRRLLRLREYCQSHHNITIKYSHRIYNLYLLIC